MTELVPDRETALRVGYEASDWAATVSFFNFETFFAPWECYAVVRHETCVGACFFHPESCEMHFSILPGWRKKWLTRDLLKRILAMPYIKTKVYNCSGPDGEGYDFMYGVLERCGFTQQDDGFFVRVSNGR